MVGANAVWIAYALGAVDRYAFVLALAGAIAALLPDIDASGRGAMIHYKFHGIFGMFKNTFRHRGFFHSLLAMWIVFILSLILLFNIYPLLPFAILFGYASHPFIDAFNAPVQYLYPHKKFFTFIPKWLRFRVGSGPDNFILFLAALGVGAFFLLNLSVFQVDPNTLLVSF